MKTLYPVTKIREISKPSDKPSDDDISDDDWILKWPNFEENCQGDEEGDTTRRKGGKNNSKVTKLAPLITMGRDIVYKPWSRRELKEIVKDFPKDIRKNKQKWREEWDSLCSIYRPHLPDMIQLLKLTLPPDVRENVIETCEIPNNPSDLAKITPEQAQAFYSIIALAVDQVVKQQTDFAALTRVKQGKEDSPREFYGRMMKTAKEDCGLSQNQIDGLSPGCLQNIFVQGLQTKIKAKVLLTIGWTGKSLSELVEIAQHHWDNTEQKEQNMYEMLMVSQVSHYTDGANGGGCNGRGSSRNGNWGRGRGMRNQPAHRHNTAYDSCFYCGEPTHWVRDCPYKRSAPKSSLQPAYSTPIGRTEY